jgi:hypothetical protein
VFYIVNLYILCIHDFSHILLSCDTLMHIRNVCSVSTSHCTVNEVTESRVKDLVLIAKYVLRPRSLMLILYGHLGRFHPFLQATKALRESTGIALLCF